MLIYEGQRCIIVINNFLIIVNTIDKHQRYLHIIRVAHDPIMRELNRNKHTYRQQFSAKWKILDLLFAAPTPLPQLCIYRFNLYAIVLSIDEYFFSLPSACNILLKIQFTAR